MTRAAPRRFIRRAAVSSVAAMLAATAAAAGERVPTATGSSERAAFQVQGLPAGGFRLYPLVRATVSYDDNVQLGAERRGGDGVVTLAPSLAARSQWSTHALDASIFLSDNHYLTRTALDNDEYGGNVDGRLDVLRTLTIKGSGGYSHLIEVRGTPGDLNDLGRFIEYNRANAVLSASKQINRVVLVGSIGGTNYRFDDVVDGGIRIDQHFRNRDVRDASLRTSYQYSATTSFFVTGSGTRIRYRSLAPGDVDRASTGFSVLGGVHFEITRLVSGEVGAGYISQSFRDSSFKALSGFNYNANIRYDPTALTSFTLSASRQLTDSALRQVGGVLASRVSVTAEHELLRNLILAADASYSSYKYRGIDATNHRYDVGIGARYKIGNGLAAALSLDHIGQSSGGLIGRRYDSNRVSFSILVAR